MDRVELKSGLSLSRLVYGMWRLGDDRDTSPAHVQAKIEACLEQGITTMDQADIYGGYVSEALFGDALRQAPGLRDKLEIVTKCDIKLVTENRPAHRVKSYDTSAAHIEASVENSLSCMNIDAIDLLLIHRPDPLMDHQETGAALDALVKSGKVRAIGVSNFRLWDWTLLQSAMNEPLVTNQIEVSVLHHDPFTNGDIAFLQERGVAPMAWSPLGGGALFDTTRTDLAPLGAILDRVASEQGGDRAAVAVAWLLRHPSRIIPVLGTNTLSRIREISAATKIEIDRETWFEIYEAALGHEVP